MEWIDGETLRSLLKRGPLPSRRALDIVQQIATGLNAAHRAGIVHRDINPSNIMITSAGVAKILDFGIARSETIDASETSTSRFIGTPHYVSPEQARGQNVDPRSDIYSLGATLYEMISGKPPFKGDNPLAIMTARLFEPVPEIPPEVAVEVPVSRVIRKMMAREPEDRFADCTQLLDAIDTVYPGPVMPAHMPRRAFAFLTDLFLVSVPPAFLFFAFLRTKGYFVTNVFYDSIYGRAFLALALLAWLCIYFVFLGDRWHRTIGQQLEGIYQATHTGEQPSLMKVLARTLVFWGPFVIALSIQSDWPPVLMRSPDSGFMALVPPNIPWIIAQLWFLGLALVALFHRRHWNIADWICDIEVVERRKRIKPSPRIPVESDERAGWFGKEMVTKLAMFNAFIFLVWVGIIAFVVTQYGMTPVTAQEAVITETVAAGDPGWDRLLERFENDFLWENETAVNPEVLVFHRRAFWPGYWANTDGALLIANYNYGVRISLWGTGIVSYDGHRSYYGRHNWVSEELQPSSEEQAARWEDRRRAAYRGSYVHFLRALMHGRLAEEGFEILNPMDFAGLFRVEGMFLLVAQRQLTVRVEGEEKPRVLKLHNNFLYIRPHGTAGGGIRFADPEWLEGVSVTPAFPVPLGVPVSPVAKWGARLFNNITEPFTHGLPLLGGGWSVEEWSWLEHLPGSVLIRYAEEQDQAWGRLTQTIRDQLSVE
jgi:hypothetical protein